MATTDDAVKWVQAIPSPVLREQSSDIAQIVIDKTTNTLKYYAGGAKEVTDLSTTQTVTGSKTFSGTVAFTGATTGVRNAVTVGATTPTVIAVADSGMVYIATRTTTQQVFTLPAASTAGLRYTFVCGTGMAANGEINIGVATGDKVIGKTHAADDGVAISFTATTGLLKNTASSNVDGDYVILVSDGVTSWYMVAQAGVWSAT